MRFVGTKSRLCSQSDKRNGKTMKKYSFFPFNLFGTCYRSSQKKGRSSQKKGRRQKKKRQLDLVPFLGQNNHLRQLVNFNIAFKPVIDNRYSQSEIVSHKGKKIMATRIKNFTDINNYSQSNIFIDEVHFFQEDIVFYLNQLAKVGKKITVAGLS